MTHSRDPINKAIEFAAYHHAKVGQMRKYVSLPYIVHPIAVSRIIERLYPNDTNMIIAAVLHDTVEDTEATLEEVRTIFGDDVASLVSDLTDVAVPSDGNRAARRKINDEHSANASARAQTVKMADIADNMSNIAEHDIAFARVYYREKMATIEVLTKAYPEIREYLNLVMVDVRAKLDSSRL